MGTSISTYSRSHDTGTLISTEFRLAASGQLRNPLYAAADPPASGGCPTGRYAPRGPCPWRPSELPPRDSRSSELFQVPKIVLVEESNVGRAGTEHRETLDSSTESEPLISRWVISDASEDIGMDHPAARGLDPPVTPAHSTLWILSFASEAIERDLGRRLGEWEIVDAETNLAIAPEDLPRECIQRPLEIGHRELLVDRETLVLEEDRFADGVRRLVPVTAAGDNDADRGLALLHHPPLHRRGMRTAEDRP